MKKLVIGIAIGLALALSGKAIANCFKCYACNGTGQKWEVCYSCNGQGGHYESCFLNYRRGFKCKTFA